MNSNSILHHEQENTLDRGMRDLFSFFKSSLVVSTIFFAGVLSAAAAPADLQVVGNQILTVSGGCTVRLRGVNVASLEWSNTGEGPAFEGVTATVYESIANWRSNVIRLPLNQDRWFGCAAGQSDGGNQYRTIVDNVLAIASSNNAYVILDLHWSGTSSSATAPCGAGWGTATGQQNMPDSNSVTFWSSVSARYANVPAALFGIYNEPHNDTWSIWRNGGMSGSGFTTPGLQLLVTAIRSTGANNMIVAGGLDWAYDNRGIRPCGSAPCGYALTDTGSGRGIAYDAHIYPWKPTPWDTYVSPISMTNAIIVGEFGQDVNDGGAWDASLISWASTRNYHSIAWDMHPSAGPVLISNWTFTPTSWHGTPVKNWLATPVPTTCPPSTPGTPTNTPTPTPSFTPTFTRTFTRTFTPSFTRTFTRTHTPTFTNTFTPTMTVTPTYTITFTVTNTPTWTRTPTPTSSPTETFTGQPTSTFTHTPTVTATPTLTFTGMPTSTFTMSSTPTSTPALTNTFTFSPTGTSSSTPSATSTFTFISTSTSTSTPVPTNSPAWTATPPATSTPTPGSDLEVSPPYPNPVDKGPVTLDVRAQGLSSVKCDVFTAAYRKIRNIDLPAVNSVPVRWDLRDGAGDPVASGIYYLRLEAGGTFGKKTVIKKVLVIR